MWQRLLHGTTSARDRFLDVFCFKSDFTKRKDENSSLKVKNSSRAKIEMKIHVMRLQTKWFSNFFWLRHSYLKVFDSTAAHLELQHQIYSSAFTLLVKKISLKHCYFERTMQNRKIQKLF